VLGVAVGGVLACGSSGSQAPSGPESPVPPDAPCTTPSGTPVTLYTGDVNGFAVDDGFVYISEMGDAAAGFGVKVSRIPIAGGTPTLVVPPAGPKDAVSAYRGFGLGDGSVLYVTPTNGLGKIPVPDDATMGRVAGGAPGFDGVNAWLDYTPPAAEYSVMAQIPIDGSKSFVTTLPLHAMTSGVAVGRDGAYAVMNTLSSGGGFGTVVKVATGGGGVTTLLDNTAWTWAIAVDDSYVYFSSGPYESAGSVARMALDGTGLTTLSTPMAQSIAVDAHAIYMMRAGGIEKLDKATGARTAVASNVPSGYLVLHGGNLYWTFSAGGAASSPMAGGVMTVCK
jgi:hypothetical protein